MAGFTDAQELVVLDYFFHDAATLYVGYSASAGTECADATYARQTIAFDAASSGATTNTAAVTFPAQTAGGNVVECALFEDLSGGAQITDWKALTAGTVALSAGQQFRIPAGDYDLTLD